MRRLLLKPTKVILRFVEGKELVAHALRMQEPVGDERGFIAEVLVIEEGILKHLWSSRCVIMCGFLLGGRFWSGPLFVQCVIILERA